MSSTIALIIAFILFLIGLVGTLLPVMPGVALIWSGMLVYGLITGFEAFGWTFLLGQALIALAVLGIDYFLTAMGSKYFGGSKAALWGAAGGLLVGIFFFPVGLLIGPFIGATLADLIARKNSSQAVKSGLGASIGFWTALPLKLIMEIVMITWFIFRVF